MSRKQVGLVIDGAPLAGPNTRFWTVNRDGAAVGKVTSAVHSPRLGQNIALAMVSAECAAIGTVLEVEAGWVPSRARVVERPFFDPSKTLAAA